MKQPIDAEQILHTVSQQVVSYVIPALISRFNFFNRVARRRTWRVADLVEHFGFDARVTDALVSFLVKEGYFKKIYHPGASRFGLSMLTRRFLVRTGEQDLSAFVTLLEGNVPKKVGDAIAFALQTGKPAAWYDRGTPWKKAMKSGSIAKSFSDGMMSRGMYLRSSLGDALSGITRSRHRLIDLGGSLGDYCGYLTSKFPQIQCDVFDLPSVVQQATKNIVAQKYRRVGTVAGDLFNRSLPRSYDIHLYSNVLHDWTPKQIAVLLRKSYAALAPGGVVIIHDLHLNNDKISPAFAVDHSLYLSIFTEGKCYSYTEMIRLLTQAGFKRVVMKKTVAGYSVIIGYK